MAARPAHPDAVAARAERPRRDALDARPIKRDERIDARTKIALSEKMTHAAQIAFAFFANIADE